MVNFVLGRAGSGKSTKLNEIILGKVKSSGEKIIVIVPEQMSFEKEKSMLEFLGNKDFKKIRVLSFSRLADFVANALKIPAFESSSDISQVIAVNQAIEKSKSELKIYLKSCTDMRLAELVLNTIRELKSNRINKEVLSEIYALCRKDILKQKIKELICIYENYKSILGEKQNDYLDTLDILEKVVKESRIFEGYTVFFDEFSNFTAQQFSILEQVISQAKDVYMAFCTDPEHSDALDYGLFLPCDKTILKVRNIAAGLSVKVGEIKLLGESLRFKNPELKTLEKNIFQPEKKPFADVPENVFLYSALGTDDESEFVARQVRRLILEGRYRYKDFAVLTRDITAYESSLKSAFVRFGIPYFIDTQEKLFGKNLTNFILSAFEVIHGKFSTEDILAYLKTGLAGFSAEEISLLENYALFWGIKFEDWKKEFSLNPSGHSKDLSKEDLNELEKLNSIRRRLTIPLENFESKLKMASGKKITAAIFELLMEVDAPENLRMFCENLEINQGSKSAEKHSLVWDTMMEVLNQVAVTLGEKKISSKKYVETLNLALNFTDFSYVPQCVDSVTVASVERTHFSGAKVVFIVGAVSGEFPKVPGSSEIFTDREVGYIASLGIELKDSSESFLLKERFLAYTAVCSPSEVLFVSWPSSDSLKKSKYPSEIVKEVKDIFPKVKVLSRDSFGYKDLILSKSAAFEAYARAKSSPSKLGFTLEKFLKSDAEYCEKCRVIENFLDSGRLNFSSSLNVPKLFGSEIKLSASQIEKYYSCRFAYFCRYGLGAKVRKTSSFGFMDYGTLVHYLFEKLFSKFGGEEIFSLSESFLEDEVAGLLEKYVSEKLGGYENKPQIFRYTIERIKKSSVFLVRYLAGELKESKFKVVGTEIEVSSKGAVKPLEFELSGGKKATVEGIIDRADLMQTPQGEFVRIIDYKTGEKRFKLSDIFYGINMQMLIYLFAVSKNGIKNHKNLTPSAMLYFTAVKPLLEIKNAKDEEKIDEDIKKSLQMNGLVLKANEEEKAKRSANSELTAEELETVYAHMKRMIKMMCDDIFLGKTSALPMLRQNVTACQRCDYHSVCGYEEENFKKVDLMSDEETLRKMREEEERENGQEMDI